MNDRVTHQDYHPQDTDDYLSAAIDRVRRQTMSESATYTPTPRQRIRRTLREFTERAISDNTVGTGSVPNSWASKTFTTSRPSGVDGGTTHYHIRFADDAFGVIGWRAWSDNPDEDEQAVCVNMQAPIFRKVALWYLWRWFVGEWFGLRRWLFYKNLNRKVRGYRRMWEDQK